MSGETLEWLNQNVLVGFQDRRPHAWHYRAALQGAEPNHYPGPIPREDVVRRLFSWQAVERPVWIGGAGDARELSHEHRAIVHSETGRVFKIAGANYRIHQYEEWLLRTLADIVDSSELQIGTAGLLRDGGRAFVTIETPESVSTRCGMDFRPQILAASSHDSSLATVYKLVATVVVCDNTLAAALWEDTNSYRSRHSKNSQMRLQSTRDALGIIIASHEPIVRFLDRLADIAVSDSEWEQTVERLVPIPEDSLPRVKARLENKRGQIDRLYREDERCRPWNGTGLGAFQAFNTYALHVAGPDNGRMSRMIDRTVAKSAGRDDRKIVSAIESVCGRPLTS